MLYNLEALWHLSAAHIPSWDEVQPNIKSFSDLATSIDPFLR